MFDISDKIKTQRVAVAQSILRIQPATRKLIEENRIPKGDPLATSKVAAIQAVKNTSSIIPYCHPIHIDFVGVEFILEDDRIISTVTVKACEKTGVEMEAITGVSVASITLYDMMKMLDDSMMIESTTLLKKRGGKSDFRQGLANKLKAAVLVMSDSVASGKKTDRSGKLIEERLLREGLEIVEYKVVADEPQDIETILLRYSDDLELDLVVTTGGTGLSPRDHTPEVMKKIIEREIPGIMEAARSYGQDRTPYAMLSRATAGVRGKTMIINLPGSSGGVRESMDALFPAVLHAFKMIWGYGHDEK